MNGAPLPYGDAQAFGTAITAHLKHLACTSQHTVTQLRRQFAYDRLLARLFIEPDSGWILKGGVSMLARLSIARHSADIDLVARANTPRAAFAALQTAARKDLGDFFTFRFDQPRALVQGVPGLRIPTEARLGPRIFERFGVDLVTGVTITGQPETTRPIVDLPITGLACARYIIYPLVDTIADKVMAIIEREHSRPSTRYRDLVDLVLIANTHAVNAAALRKALVSERFRRDVPLPSQLSVPDETTWRRGYAAIAAEMRELEQKTLDAALQSVGPFLNPVLSNQLADSTWHPANQRWEQNDRRSG